MSRTYETVKVELESGIAWVILNRPDKRNAMSPQLHYEMCDILNELEHDPRAKVLVLTGPATPGAGAGSEGEVSGVARAGDAGCAGQALRLFSRYLADKPLERPRAQTASH